VGKVRIHYAEVGNTYIKKTVKQEKKWRAKTDARACSQAAEAAAAAWSQIGKVYHF
jgi:hypothetical protein